jgi:p24 family protein delta-1
VVAMTLWWLARCTGVVWQELATTATKCLSEEIQSNVVVINDYSILYEEEHPIRPMVFANIIVISNALKR